MQSTLSSVSPGQLLLKQEQEAMAKLGYILLGYKGVSPERATAMRKSVPKQVAIDDVVACAKGDRANSGLTRGAGFYLTDSYSDASEWAASSTDPRVVEKELMDERIVAMSINIETLYKKINSDPDSLEVPQLTEEMNKLIFERASLSEKFKKLGIDISNNKYKPTPGIVLRVYIPQELFEPGSVYEDRSLSEGRVLQTTELPASGKLLIGQIAGQHGLLHEIVIRPEIADKVVVRGLVSEEQMVIDPGPDTLETSKKLISACSIAVTPTPSMDRVASSISIPAATVAPLSVVGRTQSWMEHSSGLSQSKTAVPEPDPADKDDPELKDILQARRTPGLE